MYPTVSGQPTTNADKSIDPEQIAIARYQAARFSTQCRVYAPIYRQLTLAAITTNSPEGQADAIRLAYSDVRAAWRDYLANYNRGRPFVLIGHSQGAGMLTGLLRKQIEPHRRVVDRMVSALLLGGNVTTDRGSDTGGSFRRVPLCASPMHIGCVVAFSIFNETPPDDTKFGRSTGRFADVFGLPSGPDQEVACTNPADLAGTQRARGDRLAHPQRALPRCARGRPDDPLRRAAARRAHAMAGADATAIRRECVTENEAHVLMARPVGDSNPLNPSPDATWGLHLADVNLPLGNLVELVKRQAKAYLQKG